MSAWAGRQKIALGVVAGALSAISADASKLAQQPLAADVAKSVVVGRVTTGLVGSGVPQAIVTLRGRSATAFIERTTTTDAGDFAFLNVPPGIYDLAAAKEGYTGGGFGQRRPGGLTRTIAILQAEHQTNVRLFLWPDGSICGTVSENGARSGGVAVSVMGQTATSGRIVLDGRVRHTTVVDDRGEYRISGLPAGIYVVGVVPVTGDQSTDPSLAAAAGRAAAIGLGPYFYPGVTAPTAAASIEVKSGEDHCGIDFNLRIAKGFEVVGQLKLGPADRSLVAQVVLRDDALTEDLVFREATVGRDGSFRLENVPAGNWVVRVLQGDVFGSPSSDFVSSSRSRPTRYTSTWGEAVLHLESDRRDFRIDVMPGFAVNGRIVFQGSTKPPLLSESPPVQLRLVPASGRELIGVASGFARTQSDQFLLAGLPPGRYSLQVGLTTLPRGWALAGVELNGQRVSESAVELHNDGAALNVILTDQVSEIAGTVTNSGAPDLESQVLVFPEDSRMWSGYGRESLRMRAIQVDQKGAFRIRGLLPGDYLITALPDEDLRHWQTSASLSKLAKSARRVSIRPGETTTLSLSTVRVK